MTVANGKTGGLRGVLDGVGAVNWRGGRTAVGGPTLSAHEEALVEGGANVEVGGGLTVGRRGLSVRLKSRGPWIRT